MILYYIISQCQCIIGLWQSHTEGDQISSAASQYEGPRLAIPEGTICGIDTNPLVLPPPFSSHHISSPVCSPVGFTTYSVTYHFLIAFL